MLHIDIEGIAEVRHKLGILHSAIWRNGDAWCLSFYQSRDSLLLEEIRFYSKKSEILSSCIYI